MAFTVGAPSQPRRWAHGFGILSGPHRRVEPLTTGHAGCLPLCEQNLKSDTMIIHNCTKSKRESLNPLIDIDHSYPSGQAHMYLPMAFQAVPFPKNEPQSPNNKTVPKLYHAVLLLGDILGLPPQRCWSPGMPARG